MERQDSQATSTMWQKLSPSVLTQVNGTPNDRCSKEDVCFSKYKYLFMKILLVEDDGDCWSVEDTLTAQHYLVDLAMDGQVGLSLVEAVDLVLLDVMLQSWMA